jgi:hypothetical protein
VGLGKNVENIQHGMRVIAKILGSETRPVGLGKIINSM